MTEIDMLIEEIQHYIKKCEVSNVQLARWMMQLAHLVRKVGPGP